MIFKRILIAVLILILAAGLFIFIYLQKQKPVYSGSLRLNGLNGQVDVYFDGFGVPHIYGQNEEDVFCALGYVHAQERLFQMELIRRISAGRLSELFGSAMLDVDKFFRMLGLKQHAEISAREFSKSQHEDYYSNAVAYLSGINQYIEQGKTPVEFHLMGIPKEKFTINDMFLIVDFMSFNFQMAFRTDPLMTKILRKLGREYLQELSLHHVAGTLKVPASDNAQEMTAATCFNDIFDKLPVRPWTGSNAWALAPSRTKNGKALFANDTHIAFQQPAVWYEAHLECPGLSLYGNFLAGFPYPPIAHSKHHAWGLTILENDDIDFFEEQTDSLRPNQYFHIGEWKAMAVREETIHVKDSDDVKLLCRETMHGPVCSDVIHDFDESTKNPVTASWTLLKFPTNLIGITYRISKAASIVEFRDALSTLAAPGLNVVYADSSGNIAWWTAAKLVKRPVHVEPVVLLDGSSGLDEWQGYWEFSYNPYSINPESGYVYSCNNAPDTLMGVPIPGYYTPEDRARVVTQFLERGKTFTMADMTALQNSVTSVVAAELGRKLISRVSQETKDKSPLAQKAAEILAAWNGSMQIDDAGPAIYYRFQYELLKNLMMDELGAKDFLQFQQTHVQKSSMTTLLLNDTSVWLDDRTTTAVETYQQILDLSFDSTIIFLERQLGKAAEQWKWGRVHLLEHGHPVGKQRPFDLFFNVGPFPAPGGSETVNNAGFDFAPDGYYRIKFGPALRRTLDFADPLHGRSILPTGQSGNVMSDHYNDQAKMFVNCETRVEMMDRDEVLRSAKNHLVLMPASSQAN